jgi:competence protein CoiA
MMYALDDDDRRIEATPGAAARCPICERQCIPKCGHIVIWHWAHIAREDCDLWSEPDTEWHRNWQSVLPEECREIVIGCHRADLVTPTGTIIELQHSSISPDEIAEREDFYGERLVWLFDAADAYADDRLSIRRRPGQQYVTFRWKHPRKSVACCARPVLLDLGDGRVLRVRRMYPEAPCGGWGHLGTRGAIEQWMRG